MYGKKVKTVRVKHYLTLKVGGIWVVTHLKDGKN